MSTLLTLSAITCRYGQRQVCSELSFSVNKGAIVSLLGSSGCGKTTVLRAIAGFEPLYAGQIRLGERTLSSVGNQVPPEQRKIGMVFQDYALFPHLTVAGNVGFGLHGKSASERQRIVTDMLALTRLTDYAQAWPHQLSGGQQQRVALARALAPEPELLLLDEPFSNLDTALRRSLCLEIRELLKARGITAILVTHDQSEAFSMADEVGVMADGHILQWASPQTLYLQPSSAQVARFLGQGHVLAATVHGNQLHTPFGSITVASTANRAVELLIRPSQLRYHASSPYQAQLNSRSFQGALTLSTLQLADGSLVQSDDPALAQLPLNSLVGLALSPSDLQFF